MEIPHKFWKEYESLDTLGRDGKIKHIVENMDKLFELKDKKMRQHAIKIALLGYFDDIFEFKALDNK